MSSLQGRFGLPADLTSFVCHSLLLIVHLLSFIGAMCPAHSHFVLVTYWTMSVTLVLCLMVVLRILSFVFCNVNYLCSFPDLWAWYLILQIAGVNTARLAAPRFRYGRHSEPTELNQSDAEVKSHSSEVTRINWPNDCVLWLVRRTRSVLNSFGGSFKFWIKTKKKKTCPLLREVGHLTALAARPTPSDKRR